MTPAIFPSQKMNLTPLSPITCYIIFRIFLLETLLIAMIGVVGGIALGGGLCYYYMHFPVVDRPNFVVKPLLKLSTFIIPAVIIFFATIVAGLYPAMKASRVNPVEAIWKE